MGEVHSVAGDSGFIVVGLQGVEGLVDKHFQVLLSGEAIVDLDEVEFFDELSTGFFLTEFAVGYLQFGQGLLSRWLSRG